MMGFVEILQNLLTLFVGQPPQFPVVIATQIGGAHAELRHGFQRIGFESLNIAIDPRKIGLNHDIAR